MEYLIGVLVALGVGGLATWLGWDRDRSFSPTVLIVIAAYYVLFGVMGGNTSALELELAAACGFLAVALVGFLKWRWLVAAGIAGHGLFDFVHHLFISDPGVPVWWPAFCGTVDVLLGAWLLYRVGQTKVAPRLGKAHGFGD